MNLTRTEWHFRYTLIAIAGGFVFTTCAQFLGVYRTIGGTSHFANLRLIIKAWALTWAILIIAAFLYKEPNFSRLNTSIWAITTPFVLFLYRILLLKFFNKFGFKKQKIALIGTSELAIHFAQLLQSNPWLGYEVVGFFDDEQTKTTISNKPVLGNTHEILNFTNDLDEIFFCLPLKEEDKIQRILNDLTDSTMIVKLIPDLFSFELTHAQWTEFYGFPIISLFDTPQNSNTAKFIKRSEDILLSIVILTLASPIMLIMAIFVKLTSPGPVFYKQTRVSWNGEKFSMLKFRSMPVHTDKDNIQWGNAKNKTNTRFGKFIRATSLDELPQFINVLLGDMSIVGPRPERDIFVEKFRKKVPRYMQKHMVKAGITGWAQINGWRGDTSLEKRIEADLYYINNWSLWLDLKIILLTLTNITTKE